MIWIDFVAGVAFGLFAASCYRLLREEFDEQMEEMVNSAIDRNNKNLIDELVKRKKW